MTPRLLPDPAARPSQQSRRGRSGGAGRRLLGYGDWRAERTAGATDHSMWLSRYRRRQNAIRLSEIKELRRPSRHAAAMPR